jgi:bacterioferritin
MATRTGTLDHDLADEEDYASPQAPTLADGQGGPMEIPGPITRAYKADPKHVIKRLNELRSTEIVSYLQYKQHAYMAVSLLGPSVKSEFLEHAEQELQHAERLAERISMLGGTPIYDLCDIAEKASREKVWPEQGFTIEQMVLEDLAIERAQVEKYTDLIREIGDKDPVTRRMLEDILIDTEHHASELRDLLQRRAS